MTVTLDGNAACIHGSCRLMQGSEFCSLFHAYCQCCEACWKCNATEGFFGIIASNLVNPSEFVNFLCIFNEQSFCNGEGL